MPEKKQSDIIRSFCEGADEQFRQISCTHYTHNPRKECNLLKKYEISVFWGKCRENSFELLYHAVNKHLQKFKARFGGIDEQEDVDFEGMIRRLKKQRLKHGFNLFVWHGYVSKTSYREVRMLLIRKGWIPREKKCGTCKYFPDAKPYICPITGEDIKKTAVPCEKYGWKLPVFVSEECLTDDQLPVPGIRENNPVPDMMKMLKKRIQESTGRKKRERYERQYEIFASFLSLLAEDVSEKEAIRKFADQWRISEKTIRRDIGELREFLKEKMS